MVVNITQHSVEADLCIPENSRALVVFVHGAGSSRYSTRNRYVAQVLNNSGFGTMLVDLLTTGEKAADIKTRHLRFDIALLTSRLESVTQWVLDDPRTQKLALGYFGSSTGAAAALLASTRFRDTVKAVVSRGGRPDLAEEKLREVVAPTLLIVGEMDEAVIGLNKRALKKLKSVEAKYLIIIPGAGHLFEEPGKIDQVAASTVNWFGRYLLHETGQEFRKQLDSRSVRNLLSSLKNRASIQVQFKDRAAAGQVLATKLQSFKANTPVVIGIANGGIIVADVIRKKLGADFEIAFPRRIRSPVNSESAIGAIMHDGSSYLDNTARATVQASDEYLELEKQIQLKEIAKRQAQFGREDRKIVLSGRTVILVDDGAATGSTIAVVAKWVREKDPRMLIIAVPVASPRAAEVIRKEADYAEVIMSPSDFKTVEHYYKNFEGTDSIVAQIMQEVHRERTTEKR
jgi:predicted phosphoribosyltransferase/dienelactone hydrolase